MSLCIRVENLSKFFGAQQVIKDLSLVVEEGEIIVFTGPSGVGKSTFLRCLTYLEAFQHGTIRVGDLAIQANMDVRKHREVIKNLRKQLGFVFQFFNLFPHLTVLENLTIGPTKVLNMAPEEARAEAMKLLKRVGLEQKAGAFPHALSGGQQQRVGIARSLAMRPRAILFDEPTSSLDPEMKQEIVEVMEDFARDGLTMLIVTHEPAVIERIATRVVKFGALCSVQSDQKKHKILNWNFSGFGKHKEDV